MNDPFARLEKPPLRPAAATIQRPLAAEAGASLIELMLMISVAVTILAGVLTGVAHHSQQRRLNIERSLALTACRNTVEAVRSVPIADLPALDGRGFDVPGLNGQPHGLRARAGDADGLVGLITVRRDQLVAGNVLYQVDISAAWDGGANRELRFTFLVGERR